jgi:hypothetical protein
MDWTPIIVAALSVIGSVAGILIFFKVERKRRSAEATKTEAETEEIIGRNYRAIIATLQNQYLLLSKRVAELERGQMRWQRYVGYLLSGIKVLIDQVMALSQVPKWTPDSIDELYPNGH